MNPAWVPATSPPARIVSATSAITASAARHHPAPTPSRGEQLLSVMPGLDPGIHELTTGVDASREGVDGWVEPGHDDLGRLDTPPGSRSPRPALRMRPSAVQRIAL